MRSAETASSLDDPLCTTEGLGELVVFAVPLAVATLDTAELTALAVAVSTADDGPADVAVARLLSVAVAAVVEEATSVEVPVALPGMLVLLWLVLLFDAELYLSTTYLITLSPYSLM